MTEIHSTAVVEPSVTLGTNVSIGPYCVITGAVNLGDNVKLHSHVVVAGDTHIGAGTEIFPFASIGHIPQDLKFHGEEAKLRIGKNNRIREHVTMNPGTEGGGLYTRVGDNGLFMAGAHVAHDCAVGNNVIFANNATAAGHCQINDFAILGGLAGIHQFVRIGEHAIIGGMSAVENDVIPFGSVIGNRAYLGGLNIVGLKRRGFDRDAINTMRKAYRMLFSEEGTLKERVSDTNEIFSDHTEVQQIINFILEDSHRSLCIPKSK